jgi:PhnB protein
VISLMLAVSDATAAAKWYADALGAAGASIDEIREHEMPWGTHRQGGFLDPFGHLWLVGDRSPLSAH